tara:strand:+ start:3198 stop:9659 length:6462 start_codon:yes stop_codon:yes gene_type:complete
MAESKFLKYQDPNGDNFPDVCDDILDEVGEDPKAECPVCIPNPYALSIDWKSKTEDEPFFNEGSCLFQICVVTEFTSTLEEDLIEESDYSEGELDELMRSRFESYSDIAAESLLVNYSKDASPETIDNLKSLLQFSDYDLEAREGSHLKLLYSVDYEDFSLIEQEPDDNQEEDEEDEEDETNTAAYTLSYVGDSLEPKIRKVSRSLKLYSQYLRVFRAVEGGNILKTKDNSVFNLESYGSQISFSKSVLGSMLVSLDAFLNKRKLNIPNVGSPKLFTDRVSNIEFDFNSSYKLIKLRVYTVGCSEKPFIFGRKKLKSLNSKKGWNDPTACAYFSNLDKMSESLAAREPMPWIDFVVEYTYPEVYSSFPEEQQVEAPTSSCVADKLAEEGKQLGQNLLDDAFSIGDALVYAFRKNVCLNEIEDLENEDIELGLTYVEDASENSSIVAMAKEQAYKQLVADETVFTKLCETLTGFEGSEEHTSFNLDELFKGHFAKIKLCGMFDLLSASIACLIKGMTFEQAIGAIARSALKAMSIHNLSDLFIGLPPDKQEEINNLAKEKISTGDVFKNNSLNQQISANISNGSANPPDLTTANTTENQKQEQETEVENGLGAWSRTKNQSTSSSSDRRTLVQTLDPGSENNTLDNNVLIEAYAGAIIEVYSDNVLDIVERLDRYPGAQMIKNVLAYFDCPQDPIMDPSIMDFIKDIELPFCRNMDRVAMPQINNPFGWIPEVKDFKAIFIELMKQAIRQLIVNLIVKLIIKVCSIASGALCKTLETAGGLIASLPDISTARDNFKNVIRDHLCGEDSSDDQLEDTIDDLLNQLGGSTGPTASEDSLKNYITDVSASATQVELMAAIMGNPFEEFLVIAENIRLYEYSELESIFPNREAIANFFENVGNVLPADARDAIDDQLNNPPDYGDPDRPVNPSLCLTEDDWEAFCEYRQQLLAGRATPTQIREMCDSMRNQMEDDLGELSDILQGGIPNYLDSNMPPLIQPPGCGEDSTGLVPFETEAARVVATNAIRGDFENLQLAYTTDMLGDGPFQSQWGMMNLILSDTMGNPLTAHTRKSLFSSRYVDFYSDTGTDDFGNVPPVAVQKGAYPEKVAEWLQYQLAGSNNATDLQDTLNFQSTNDWRHPVTASAAFSSLNINKDIKYFNLPDMGYNVDIRVRAAYDTGIIDFIKIGRKNTPDIILNFKDNARGLRTGDNSKNSAYTYGFDIECYFSDLAKMTPALSPKFADETSRASITNQKIHNIPTDNVRLVVNDYLNDGGKRENPLCGILPFNPPPIGEDHNFTGSIGERRYEIFVETDLLEQVDFDSYPKFKNCFLTQSQYTPQVNLLSDMTNVSVSSVKTFYDSVMNNIISDLFSVVGSNDIGFEYGAQFDGLSTSDVEYVLGPGYRDSGLPYGSAEIEVEDDDGNTSYRPIINDDMILGMSHMQYQIESGQYTGTSTENRVFYLDPTTFGGSYMNPPVYIKPEKNTGWLGLAEALFPEIGPCRTTEQQADLINFQQINDIVSDAYSYIPEDPRLKAGGKDCVLELPYNRILERSSAASLEGLIIAAIRIYASTHMIKSLATFSKFKPSFPDVFGPLYAQHIVESMEASLSGADSEKAERFSLFKDTEFYMAFLEQAVQMYARRIDNGKVLDAPSDVMQALFALNDVQSTYEYPSKRDLRDAKDLDEVPKIKTLKNYREDLNFNEIFLTKDEAKKVLRQLVLDELNHMGDRITKSLETMDITPEIDNIGYYVLEKYTQGSSLELKKDNFIQTTEELPTSGEGYYTNGGELSVYVVNESDSLFSYGDEYIGYYHVHIDNSGNTVYMAGEEHRDSAHNVLLPYANKIIVPVGDVSEIGTSIDTSTVETKPFMIEKYIKINDEYYTPSEALSIINENDGTLNLSDVYPGTLALFPDEEDPTGLTGEIGVKYGLRFSIIIESEKHTLIEVELDALDLKIMEFVSFDGNSKTLVCLLGFLKNHDMFNVIINYIFNFNKITSILAIYNDLGFFPSIGEVTAADGEAFGLLSNFNDKPGMRIDIETNRDDEVESITELSNTGWASAADRMPGIFTGLFVREWDNWDKITLRRSKHRIKRMFKTYYKHGWSFSPGDFDFPNLPGPGQLFFQRLRSNMFPTAGEHLLPWWKRGKLRLNPFDSEGNICEPE